MTIHEVNHCLLELYRNGIYCTCEYWPDTNELYFTFKKDKKEFSKIITRDLLVAQTPRELLANLIIEAQMHLDMTKIDIINVEMIVEKLLNGGITCQQ